MNKKRYIPLVVIGALILSLIVVFPVFGAGDAGFIMPGVIDITNDGGLDDDTPDEQEYGRQGGNIGLYLDDDSLDVPIRRVLIPGIDTSTATDSGAAHVMAHSDIMYTTAELAKGAFVTVGGGANQPSYPVRKVEAAVARTAVPAGDPDGGPQVTTVNTSREADDTGNTTNNWYLRIEAPDGATAISEAATNVNTSGIAGIVFGGFKDGEAVKTSIDIQPAGAVATALRGAFTTDLPTKASDGEDGATTPGQVLIATEDLDPITSAQVMEDTVYTVTIKVEGDGDTDGDDTPTAAKTDTLRIHIYYPTMVRLDRPFPVSSGDTLLPVREVEIESTTESLVKWSDNYSKYALALPVSVDGSDRFILGDRLLANSNIASTNPIPNPAPTASADLALAGEKQRLSGKSSGRVGLDDALVFAADGTPALAFAADGTTPTAAVAYASRNGDLLELASGVTGFVVGWFHEKNDTGDTVTVRSQAYQTKTTLVMQETGVDTGKFALKVMAVPFGTPTADDPDTDEDETVMRYEEPMVNAMDGEANPLPMFPVNTRDVVTLSGSGSSATLTIETDAPVFTGLSPAHNFAESDARPTISGQVTDGDSGLKEGNIKILFLIDGEDVDNETPVLIPEDHGDVDDISGGFEISGRLSSGNFEGDATISWWILATDNAGNIGYSDRVITDDDGSDPCMAMEDVTASDATLTVEDLADMGCQPYVVLVDDTQPTLEAAETGRHWNTALRTGDSKDKTEYRVTKANASSVLVVFSEHLDATTVSASDFEVNGATPDDANSYNVTVRPAMDEDVTDYADYNPGLDSVTTSGEKLGYVFLRLGSDLKASAEPKVELVGEVLDLAGNEQDTGTIASASDRIAPTLTVTIDEGSRPSTMGKVNLTITSDENIGSPTVEYAQVISYDGDAMVTDNSDEGMGTAKFVSATEYTAQVSAGGKTDGVYTIQVKATDASGGNVGITGDMAGAVDVSDDTKAVLFELDEAIGAPDINPDKAGIQDSFATDDMNGYIRIDFSAEAREYDNAMYDHDMDADTDEIMGDDLDTHAGITIVSATLNGDDITAALQSNSAGNVFLYRAPDGLTVGEHMLEVVAMDDAGNKHPTTQKATIEITERKPFSLKLNPGWNLVSIPGEPADPDINVVIPADRTDITSVLAYDPTVPGLWLSASRGADGMFSGTLKNVTATRGYWVETNTFSPLPVMIPKQSPGQARVLPTIPVAKGWNMVPILDVDGDFKLDDDDKLPVMGDMEAGTRGYLGGLEGVRAYTFNTITNRWDLVSEVQIGKGYWVYVSKAGIIVP